MPRNLFCLLVLLCGCHTAEVAVRPISGVAVLENEPETGISDSELHETEVARAAFVEDVRHDQRAQEAVEELPPIAQEAEVAPKAEAAPESAFPAGSEALKSGPVLLAPGMSEPAAPGTYALTLDSLVQMALGSNPTIAQAASLVRQQEGMTVQAGLYPNPQAGYVRSDPNKSGESRTSGVFLSQTFITAGKLRLARRASRYDVILRDWQLDAQMRRVVNDVRVRFYEVLGAQEALAAAQELEKEAAEGVRIAKELVEAQRAGRPDLLQAEMQLTLAQGAVNDAQLRLEAGRRQLASLAGVRALPRGDLAGSLEDAIPDLQWESSLERLLNESPLLKSQAAELQAAQTEVMMARRQAVPDLNLQVVAQRDSVMNYNSVSTFLAMPVPVFNRNQGNVIQAEAFLAQQRKEYERLEFALTDQLAVSFERYARLRSQAERVKKELLPRAKENLELTTEAYRQGRMDFLRVVDARRTYFQTRIAQIDALAGLQNVIVEIEGLELSGGLNPTEIGTALQTLSGGRGAGARNVLLQQIQSQNANAQRNLPGAIQATEK